MEVLPVSTSEARRFGRYLLAQRIAHGGMASVHLAQLKGEGKFSKWVAVKVVHRQYAGDPKFERMFLNEARLLARIDHPNVCQVFDFGEVNGIYYLAMEYLHGQTLHRVMKQHRPGALSYECAARIVADAADGLHAAHELIAEDGSSAKVVHRDVSPSNLVVLYSGVTKVLDFGIARSADREEEFTSLDEIKGKLAYMAPEQLKREEVDRRADVFSLGIVLWELTCGRRLFKRKNEGETVVALLQEPIPTPTAVVPDYPPALQKMVMRALARDRNKRYQTAAEMARDLEQFVVESGHPAGHSHVAEAIRGMFGPEIDEHTSSLRRSAELLKHIEELTIPDLEVDMEVGEPVEAESLSPASLRTPAAVLPAPKPRRASWMVVGGALLLAAAVGVPSWLAIRPSKPSAPSPVQAAVAAPATRPAVAPPPKVEPTVAEPAVEAEPVAKAPESPPAGHHGSRHKAARAANQPSAKVTAPSSAASSSQAIAAPAQKPARRDDTESSAPRPMTSFE